MDTQEIKNKTIRSIVALTGRQMISQIISLATLIPLGLFLAPTALGTFVAVTAITPFFNFFVDLGLGSALIQKKEEPSDDDLKTVFTTQTILVGLIILVGLLLTGFLRDFSHLTSDGVNLYRVLLLVLFVSSLKSIPSILLERHIKFERQVIPSIIEQFVYSVIVVILAYKGFGVASYSWAFAVSALVGLPIYYYLSPWRIKIGISRASFQKLFSYGILYQSKTFLSLIKDNLLTVFLSGLPQVGTYGLGQVGWWQRWAYSPYNFIVASVTKVTFPTYARVQEDKEKLRAGIERSLFAVSLIMFPVAVAMAVSMSKILTLFPKYQIWAPGLPAFYFFCAGAAVSSLSGILVNTLDSTGHVKTTSALMIFWIILIWPLTLFLVNLYGFTGVAAAPFFVSLTVFLTAYLVNRVVKFNFIGSFIQPLVSSIVMGLTMILIGNLFLSLLMGAIIYVIFMWLLAKDKLLDNSRVILAAFKK
ncbi:MAG: oligosaccharide flippase family protein [bacterium]|nr:oligosaccharide flippase family protein [bacterium]